MVALVGTVLILVVAFICAGMIAYVVFKDGRKR